MQCFCIAPIYYIQWQPVSDWDCMRDETVLIWISFGKTVYVTFLMLAFVISIDSDYVVSQLSHLS